MKQHLLRVVAGSAACGLLALLAYVVATVPATLGIALVALVAVVAVATLVYKVGEFIGYVFFNGNF